MPAINILSNVVCLQRGIILPRSSSSTIHILQPGGERHVVGHIAQARMSWSRRTTRKGQNSVQKYTDHVC
jgi:hypothetical protein